MKLFLPIFKMKIPEIVDLALPSEGVFHNLVFVSIRKTYPMQAYKNYAWSLGHWADDVQQIHRCGVRRRERAQHERSFISSVREHRPATQQPFHKGLSDVLDHATSQIASGSKLGIDAVKKKVGALFGNVA